MEWISVKDRLPEEDVEVLLRDTHDYFLGGWNGSDWISTQNGDELVDIIYWAYLVPNGDKETINEKDKLLDQIWHEIHARDTHDAILNQVWELFNKAGYEWESD